MLLAVRRDQSALIYQTLLPAGRRHSRSSFLCLDILRCHTKQNSPDPVINLMRAEAPRCAVVCGISCIRPWAPAAAFPTPYDGGLFECLRSGPVTPVRIQCTRQAHVTRCPESSVPVWPRGGELVRFPKEELDLLRIPIPGLASVVKRDDVVSVASTRNKIDQRSGHPALTCPAR